MQLSEIKELIGTTASASTIIQFLSGILVCQKFMKKGTAHDVSGFPFISGFLSCSLWLGYGYVIDDWALMLVNVVGSLLMLSYVIAYYLYSTRKTAVLKQMLISTIIVILAQVYARYEEDKELAKSRLGLIGCCFTLLFFAAPLANLAHVIKTKSSESLPFPIILMSMLVTAQWVLYGIVLEDNFIIYPNAMGCLLSTCQLSLFLIYPSR